MTRRWLAGLATFALTVGLASAQSLDSGNAELRAIARGISAAHIRADIHHLVGFGTRSSLSDPSGADGRGVGAARDWIAAQFRADSRADGGRLQVRLDSFTQPPGPRVPQATTMTDVIAVLPGTDPNDHRIFVVGGHYDSRASNILDPTVAAPGANDDGSGTSVVLECARVLSQYRFPATIEFIAFEGEEQGLDGSRHAAQEAKQAGQEIVAMLNNDIVGGDNTPGHANTGRLRVFSEGVSPAIDAAGLRRLAATGGEDDSPSREIARFASALAASYLPDFHVVLEYRRDRYLRGGDHISFNDAGYPAVRFTDFFENYNHQHQTVRVVNGVQYGDLPQYTTPSYTANVARVNALALAALAMAPPAPAHAYFLPRLETGTSLRWDAVTGAVAYRILLRPTAAPQWTERRTVHGTQAHLDESKDNYFIGIAAVGAGGLESPPTLPSLPPFRRRPAAPAAH